MNKGSGQYLTFLSVQTAVMKQNLYWVHPKNIQNFVFSSSSLSFVYLAEKDAENQNTGFRRIFSFTNNLQKMLIY